MPLARAQVRETSHPLDVVEQLAARSGWSFEREIDDEISVSVSGGWSDYHLSFTWLPDQEALHLGCAFDVKAPERRRAELGKLLALVNEQLWVGHFGFWEQEAIILFRHAILVPEGQQPDAAQCEAAARAAIEACERYYQAVQFVLWSGRGAKESLDAALFETAGEA
jgi:hypothetical protein